MRGVVAAEAAAAAAAVELLWVVNLRFRFITLTTLYLCGLGVELLGAAVIVVVVAVGDDTCGGSPARFVIFLAWPTPFLIGIFFRTRCFTVLCCEFAASEVLLPLL